MIALLTFVAAVAALVAAVLFGRAILRQGVRLMETTQQVQATEQQALDALDGLRAQLVQVGDAIHEQMHTLETHLKERLGSVSPDFSKVLERTRAIADAVKAFVPDPEAQAAAPSADAGATDGSASGTTPVEPTTPIAAPPEPEEDPELLKVHDEF